jgi:hypothetical protein
LRINDFSISGELQRKQPAESFLECRGVSFERYRVSGCLAYVKGNNVRMIIGSAPTARG